MKEKQNISKRDSIRDVSGLCPNMIPHSHCGLKQSEESHLPCHCEAIAEKSHNNIDSSIVSLPQNDKNSRHSNTFSLRHSELRSSEESKNADIPKGYKHTALGILPQDWEVVRLGDITKITAGGTPNTNVNEYWNGDIKWMNSGELNYKIIYDVAGRITEKGLKNSSTKIIPVNCILVGLAGQGKTRGTIATNMVPLCTNQSIAAIYPNHTKFYYKYLYFNLDSRYNELRQLSTGEGGRGGLNLSIIGNLFIPLPPIKEQEKIAQILNTWDSYIGNLEKLIEAKQRYKKGLMQRLLTPPQEDLTSGLPRSLTTSRNDIQALRFKEFSGTWQEVKLGDIGESYMGLNQKRAEDFKNGNAKYITYKNIFENSCIDTDSFEYVFVGEYEKQNPVKFGDLFFTISSETQNEVGMSSVLLKHISEEMYLNSFCFGFRLFNFENLNPYFARFYFRSREFRKNIIKLSQGSTRFNISKTELLKIKIYFPRLQEQEKIARVLSLCDEEIQTLKKMLESRKKQKRGLMQNLLSGKVRVKA